MGIYHNVTQGECFSSLAHRYGFENYRAIFDHPENEELKKARQNPNILFPNDVVFIPETNLKEYDGATEQKHTFVLKREKVMFRIAVKNSDEKPIANVNYELKIDKNIFEGVTDSEGKLEQQIPADARAGGLILFSNETDERKIIGMFPLKLGHLDPIEEITGVQSRLNNLGFHCGKVDGILGKKTAAALREFQEKNELPATGEADSVTRSKLKQIHDWE